jgi:hypothetical protein
MDTETLCEVIQEYVDSIEEGKGKAKDVEKIRELLEQWMNYPQEIVTDKEY